jgi:hypothetical protein
LRNHSFCAAAQAATVYNYKHKMREAGEPAVSTRRFTTGSRFFVKYNDFQNSTFGLVMLCRKIISSSGAEFPVFFISKEKSYCFYQ